jgi:hypothetical protein
VMPGTTEKGCPPLPTLPAPRRHGRT